MQYSVYQYSIPNVNNCDQYHTLLHQTQIINSKKNNVREHFLHNTVIV